MVLFNKIEQVINHVNKVEYICKAICFLDQLFCLELLFFLNSSVKVFCC